MVSFSFSPFRVNLSRSLGRSLVAATALSLCSVSAGFAHLVFLEELPDKSLVLRFGDPGEKIETSPGHLDSIPETPAFTLGEKGPELAKATRGKDAISYEKATSAAPLLVDIELAVRPPRKPEDPAMRTVYHARWHAPGAAVPAAAEQKLDFDIVPVADGKLKVLLRGKPMPELKVTVEEPGGTKQELKTDAEGVVAFTPTKPGLNIIVARFREELGGFYRGTPYKLTSHIAVLSWPVPGAPAVTPTPPPAPATNATPAPAKP